MQQIAEALDKADEVKEKPVCIIADTVKGKGIPFAEGVACLLYTSQSFQWKQPVGTLIATRMPMTIALSVITLVFAYALAIPIGIYSARHQYSIGDYLASILGFIGLATPSFFLALIPVSYTHLDVYKRQDLKMHSPVILYATADMLESISETDRLYTRVQRAPESRFRMLITELRLLDVYKRQQYVLIYYKKFPIPFTRSFS